MSTVQEDEFQGQSLLERSAPAPRISPIRAYDTLLVFILTIIAAALRFSFLSTPALWEDEERTYARVCGTFNQMLDTLQTDGFTPLHYELYWIIGRILPLNPSVMRLVPALAGTLMVPAMYFLARQIVSRRTALVTAAMTCCSAFMLHYSRDAKMYMEFWLCEVLSVAFLLCWLREGKRIAWLAWVAAGVAACGLHALGLGVLALQLLFALTYRRLRIGQGLFVILGVAVILAGPVGYYVGFNHWRQQIDRKGFDAASGLEWADQINHGRSGESLALESATMYLFGWGWGGFEEHTFVGGRQIPPRVQGAADAVTCLLLALLILGLIPWPRAAEADQGYQSWPQALLWVSSWLVLPSYFFFFLLGEKESASTIWFNWTVLCVLTGVLILAILSSRWPPLAIVAAPFLPVCALLTACEITVRFSSEARRGFTSQSLGWMAGTATIVFLFQAWHRSGSTFHARLRKTGRLMLVLSVSLAICLAARFAVGEYQLHHRSASAALGEFLTRSLAIPRYVALVWPAFAIAVAALLMRLPTRPLRWSAVALLLAINVFVAVSRLFPGNPVMAWLIHDPNLDGHQLMELTQPPTDRVVADFGGNRSVRFHVFWTRACCLLIFQTGSGGGLTPHRNACIARSR